MATKKTKRTMLLLLTFVLMNAAAPTAAHPIADGAISQVRDLVPMSQEMIDQAIAVLSGGLASMTPSERALFDQLFDPGSTGDVDEAFVADVLDNYKRIRRRLNGPLPVALAQDSNRCQCQRLYFTDLVTIHVCPYFEIEDSANRKARVLIHEAVHMSLLVVDRPYFHKNTYSTRYRALTPRGSWIARLPLLGPLFRELARGDTLYHPDAYAWFAVELAAS